MPDSPPGFLPYGHQSITEDDIAAVAEVLRGDWLTTGPAVTRFEDDLAARTGGAPSDAEVAQAFDVAAHTAGCDGEPVGQLLTGPHAAGLQQAQQLQHPARRFGHGNHPAVLIGLKLSYMADRVAL